MLFARSFRSQMALWFCGLSLGTLASVGLYLGHVATQQRAETTGQGLRARAVAVAQLLALNLREREQEIELLSQAPQFERGDFDHPDVRHMLLLRQEHRTDFAWLGVADAQGRVVQAVDGLLQGESVAARPWFKAARQGVYTGDVHEAVLLAKLLPAPASGEPMRFIDFAAPIHNTSGELLGVLGAHSHWRWVTDTVKAAAHPPGQAPDGVEVLILDQQGAVLYPEHLIGSPAAPASTAQEAGFRSQLWPDGVTYLTSWAPLTAPTRPPLGWQIVLRQPLAQALAPIHALRGQLMALGALAVLVFTGVGLWLAQRVSRPIEALATVAQQVEREHRKPQFPEPSRVHELAQLSQSLRSMTQSLLAREEALQALNQTLETQVEQRTRALAVANRQLAELATHDPLTGLPNRRWLEDKLTALLHLSQRTGDAFGLVLLDIDHFKRINDTHGHGAGDIVLQQFAHVLRSQLRVTDMAARWGGEEFVVLVPLAADALSVADKIRHAVAQGDWGPVGAVTVSAGVGLWHPEDTTAQTVLQRADQALYQAKDQGRNRTVLRAPAAPNSEGNTGKVIAESQ